MQENLSKGLEETIKSCKIAAGPTIAPLFCLFILILKILGGKKELSAAPVLQTWVGLSNSEGVDNSQLQLPRSRASLGSCGSGEGPGTPRDTSCLSALSLWELAFQNLKGGPTSHHLNFPKHITSLEILKARLDGTLGNLF